MSEHAAHRVGPPGPLDFLREAAGGVSATFVLLAQMLTLGLIAYGSLGPVAVESGVRAAFAAAIFGNLTAAILGGALLPNEIPRASTVLVFAAFVTRLAGDPVLRGLPGGGTEAILFLAALCVSIAGLIQVGFGVLRLGSIARFVPYPVVAGLMTGLSVSLVLYELPHILGTHAEGGGHGAEAAAHGAEAAAHGGWQPWTLLLALFTIATVVVVGRRWPRAPSKLIGVAVGTIASVAVAHLFHAVDLGPRLPELGGQPFVPDSLFPLASAEGLRLASKYIYEIVISAAAIAVIGALDSLLAAVGEMDGPLDTGHQPNRLLIALGLGNVMSGLFGGVPLAYSSHHALVKHHDAAARAVMPSVVTTGTLVLLILYGGPLLQQIPVAVLAGVMTVIAIGLIDRWAGAVVQRARRQRFDRELTLNVVLVLFVAGVTIVFGLVTAVVTGLIVSMALFIAMMNRSLVRAVSTGETRASRRVYPPAQAALLREQGKRIKLIDVDGAIFFGTSDRLGAEAQKAAVGAGVVILDLRRVTMIDASGALMLERLSKSLRDQGIRLLLAHLSTASPLGRALQAAGAFTQKHHPDWFPDGDHALEWAERQILAEADAIDARSEIRIGEFALMAGLSDAELDFMKPYLDRQLLPARAPLFREGQKGDRMYLLARGAVSIVAEDETAAGKDRRIVTLAPGVIFGESAMLEGSAHSVTAIAEEEIVLYSLSRGNLEAIRAVAPDLYRRLLLNLLAHLAALVRMTASVLRED